MAERTSYRNSTAYRSNTPNRNNTTYTKGSRGYHEYVDGNTVKKERVYEVPQRTERVYYNNKRVEGVSRRTLRNREKALHMSAPYVVVLAVCSMIMCIVCANYLSLRDEVTNKTEQINNLEVKTEALKSQNDWLDYSINSYKDVAYISQVATQELGMVQAGKEQISFYESSESEYMKQYKNIPAN